MRACLIYRVKDANAIPAILEEQVKEKKIVPEKKNSKGKETQKNGRK